MVHRLLSVTLMMMAVVVTVAGQDRYDDRLLRERVIRLEPFIITAAMRYGVDARILRAICFVESGYRVNAVSPKGARGPMQFMPDTATRYALRDPYNPEQAIDAAARYLRDLLKRFNGRVDLAVAAYNSGEGAVISFMTGRPLILRTGKIVNARGVVTGGVPPYAETQRYVRSVLKLLNNAVKRPVEQWNLQPRSTTRRDVTIDAFDRSKSDQKISFSRASSFIDVP